MTPDIQLKPVVIGLAVSAAILAGVFTAGAVLGDDPRPPSASPSPTTPDSPWATAHRSIGERCDDVLTRGGPRVSEQTADADREYMTEQLMGGPPDTGDIRSVGLSSCGDLPVVSVGVRHDRVRIPAIAPGGTPVVVFRELPIVAF
ncbi:hypothetical protein [Aeromicrobium fastidiosum]|uniref:Uncharacterized protein n=1 Tax=Aeromicrobium fastidiosum TaxID=52699 RepID=A0A641AN42_9ACTN|nr:hypothetical protein [Aeromicrobium fastidiosum]KAA1376344.1 hypothetical protein ESP62_012990 [Aeromicrobium fastidiosum]MBP2391756.1 hypothetical protein [Aeromicrobium fastidiosum]